MEAILDFFTEPLNYVFIQRGLLALVLVGTISAVIGCFVVVRGLSFFGDALAHAVLPGVAKGTCCGDNHILTFTQKNFRV